MQMLCKENNTNSERLFGKKDRFFLDANIKHVNHASYGAVSKYCWDKIRTIQKPFSHRIVPPNINPTRKLHLTNLKFYTFGN